MELPNWECVLQELCLIVFWSSEKSTKDDQFGKTPNFPKYFHQGESNCTTVPIVLRLGINCWLLDQCFSPYHIPLLSNITLSSFYFLFTMKIPNTFLGLLSQGQQCFLHTSLSHLKCFCSSSSNCIIITDSLYINHPGN